MEILLDVLAVIGNVLAGTAIGALGAVVAMLAIGALHGLLVLLPRLPVAFFKAVRTRTAWPWLACSLTLLVRFDEESGRFHPSVQLRGKGMLRRPWIRLELVDGDGATRLVRARRLPSEALGSELELPAFELPDGVSAEDVLSWRWDVVIEDKGWPLARWREHPRPVGCLNAEAELA